MPNESIQAEFIGGPFDGLTQTFLHPHDILEWTLIRMPARISDQRYSRNSGTGNRWLAHYQLERTKCNYRYLFTGMTSIEATDLPSTSRTLH